jgi:hypothetical protein
MAENSLEQLSVSDRDLSDENEDNKYEPFTFKLKSDSQCDPNKAEDGSSSSASSTTDSEDEDDFIQLDTICFANSFPNPSSNDNPSAISCKNINPDELLLKPTGEPVSSAHLVETTNCSNAPPPQDTSRIPSSVFTTQSKFPKEWSIVSAESLFSLNLSNLSFTQENASFNGLLPDSPTPTTPGSAISIVSDVSLEEFARPLPVLEEMRESANEEVVKEDGVELEKDGEDGLELETGEKDGVELGTGGGRDAGVPNLYRSDSVSSMQSFAFPVYDLYPVILYLS